MSKALALSRRQIKMVCVGDGVGVPGALCGGDPDVYLTVRRNGQPFLADVVLGASCNALPNVTRLMVADGPASWRGRETQVCYATGEAADPEVCDWTQGTGSRFDQRFPLDQARVRNIATHQEWR